MNDNLLNHYKVRSPEDTINIVKNFFYKNNFIIKESINEESESGTHYCRIELYRNNQFIIATNGKGVNEIYSLASGYGELYERFCNKIIFLQSGISYPKMKELNILDNIDTRTIEQICEDCPPLLEWGSVYFKNDMELFSNYYHELTNDIPQADNFISFDDPDNLKPTVLDSKVLLKMTGSKGMVAGNSLEEALNQGLSELYEDWAHENLYLDPPKHYYVLSDNILSATPVWTNIQKIRELGYIIYVIDLGYNYNCPVIATYLINPKDLNIFLNIGSFPVLDIAIERTITEIYQGISNFSISFQNVCQIPYRTTTPFLALSNNANSLMYLAYDEKIFNNLIFVDEPSNAFLFSKERNTYSNIEINNYFKNLNKEHNFHFYYKNNSLTPEMTALYIICLDMKPWRQVHSRFSLVNNIFRKNHLKEAFTHFNFLKSYLSVDKPLEEKIKELLTLRVAVNFSNRDGTFIGNLLGGDLLSFYAGQPTGSLIFEIFSLLDYPGNISNINFSFTENIYNPKIKKYKFLQNYISAGYTREEILDFYEKFKTSKVISLDPITEEDFNNIFNSEYLINEVFIKPFMQYYNSQDYADVLKIAYGKINK